MPSSIDPSELARALVAGTREELALTPKPGLVDRADNGSHPDLDYARMSRSIDLMPLYFDELITLARAGRPLAEQIAAGRRAEARMEDAIHANAHRGFIFLAGLVLLGALRGNGGGLRDSIAGVAREFFAGADPRLGRRGGLGGIREEALRGLPSVFEIGLPGLRRRRDAGGNRRIASYELMARLMRCVADTTALRRCGSAGLARLRRDGDQILDAIEHGGDPRAMLSRMNDEYRAMLLTMGGVADCMAITFAIDRFASPGSLRETAPNETTVPASST